MTRAARRRRSDRERYAGPEGHARGPAPRDPGQAALAPGDPARRGRRGQGRRGAERRTTSSRTWSFALMEMKSETLAKIDEAMQPPGGRAPTAPAPSAATEIAEARLQAAALRDAVPRLPGARGGRPRGRAAATAASAGVRSARPHGPRRRADVARRTERTREMSEPKDDRAPDFESGGVQEVNLDRGARGARPSCRSGTPSCSRTPSCPWRWRARARWRSCTTRCASARSSAWSRSATRRSTTRWRATSTGSAR